MLGAWCCGYAKTLQNIFAIIFANSIKQFTIFDAQRTDIKALDISTMTYDMKRHIKISEWIVGVESGM